MRQSLSETPKPTVAPSPRTGRMPLLAVASAVLLSVVLAVAAIVDQAGAHHLEDHATALYASYDEPVDPNVLYGLLYAVAAVNLVLWLLVGRVARSAGRSAAALAVVVSLVTAALAATLLTASEYGEQLFPPVWGVLAALPLAGGVVAVVQLVRGRPGRP